jgi:GNAT superfamily N-acetyltransferase
MSLSADARDAGPTAAVIEIVADRSVDVDAFLDILARSGLAERRPAHQRDRLAQMVAHANLTVTAWDGELLVGISRSLTDFSYVCYCADLAVDRAYQGRGIGKALLDATRARLHPQATLYLRSAPDAVGFYEKIALAPVGRFFAMLPPGKD